MKALTSSPLTGSEKVNVKRGRPAAVHEAGSEGVLILMLWRTEVGVGGGCRSLRHVAEPLVDLVPDRHAHVWSVVQVIAIDSCTTYSPGPLKALGQ